MVTDSRPSSSVERWRIDNDRLSYLIISVILLAVVVVARLLTPAPAGLGTHEQLGLPPCTFHFITGHGCPGCGLTTSFAHMARGELSAALQANPMGAVLFALTLVGAAGSIYRIFRPRPINDLFNTWIAQGLLLGLIAGSILVWLVRLAAGQI